MTRKFEDLPRKSINPENVAVHQRRLERRVDRPWWRLLTWLGRIPVR